MAMFPAMKGEAILYKFQFRDTVIIDDDNSLTGVITRVMSAPGNRSYEVSYIHNGDAKAAWIEEFRLTLLMRKEQWVNL